LFRDGVGVITGPTIASGANTGTILLTAGQTADLRVGAAVTAVASRLHQSWELLL
jgi:hypothetical protein